MDKSKSKILVLVEGAKTDVRLMEHLLSIYGIDANHEIIPYNTNIYTLYNEMFRDDDPSSLDLLQTLKARERDLEKKALLNERYSDVLLIFDLDPQDPQFSPDKIKKMAAHFVESSDMGKLYLNYPMVEAFYHMSDIPDAAFLERMATLQELAAGTYKTRVNQENRNRNYTKFATTKKECNIVITQNLQKAWHLLGSASNESNPAMSPSLGSVLDAELALMEKTRALSVLCTCTFYIMDYNPHFISNAQNKCSAATLTEPSADPFYSESNMEHLKNLVARIDNGTSILTEHALIPD